MKRISILDKIAAWVLMACFILYMLTGFDIQLRFMSASLSSLIHLKYLFLIAQAAFLIHTSYAIHLAFKRWKIWNGLGKTLLGVYGAVNLGLIGLYLYIQI